MPEPELPAVPDPAPAEIPRPPAVAEAAVPAPTSAAAGDAGAALAGGGEASGRSATAPDEPGGPGPADGQGEPGEPGEPGEAGQRGGEGEPGERRRRRRRRRGRRREGEGAAAGTAPDGTPLPRPEPQDRPPPARPEHAEHGRRDRDDRGFRPPHGRARNSEHFALIAMKALSRMAQALFKIEGVDPLSLPRSLDLQLRIPLDEHQDGRRAAAAAVEQILQRVQQVREHERALVPGSVFCYFTGSAAADHCRPSEPRQVFEGYNTTGKPVFADFVTMAIERKDPGLDQLLAGDDVVLTHVSMGRVLRTQQLAEFGGNSPVFKILGQVDAGLFRVLGADQKCAFSFQLLRGTTLEGKPRLRLHAVGKVDLMDLADPALLHILSRFQRHLDTEALRLQGKEQNGGVDDEAFVLPMLQDLAQKLVGRSRSAGRRTQHGLARSEEGQRPTPRAYPDAGEAHDEAILWDAEKSTIVVLGPKGRVHVFTPLARHVTSVMMHGPAIERRRHQGRWREAEPEERGEFRIQLKRLVAAGEAKPVDDGPLQPEV